MPANDLKWSDARRILAVELHEDGMDVQDIMPIVKAAESTKNRATAYWVDLSRFHLPIDITRASFPSHSSRSSKRCRFSAHSDASRCSFLATRLRI